MAANDFLGQALDQFAEQQAPQASSDTSFMDEAVDSVGQAARGRNALAAMQSFQSDPEQYEKHKRLGDEFGLPVDLVGRNYETLDRQAKMGDLTRLLDKNPALGKWYTEADNVAAIKIDELRHLSGLSWLGAAGAAAYGQGRDQVSVGNLRWRQIMGDATDEDIALANSIDFEDRSFGADSWFEKSWIAAAKMLPIRIEQAFGALRGASQGAAGGGLAALIGGQLGPQVAAPEEIVTVPLGMAIGAKIGGTYGALETSMRIEGGLAFDEFINFKDKDGGTLDPDVARVAALAVGSIAGGFEFLGLKTMMDVVPGLDKVSGAMTVDAVKLALQKPSIQRAFKNFALNTGKTMTAETMTEIAQESVVMLGGELAKLYSGQEFPALTWEDAAERLSGTIEETMQAMTIYGPLGAGSRLGHDISAARRADRHQTVLDAIIDHASNDELLKRLPDKAREAVKAITADGPVQSIFMDPRAFQEYFQTNEEMSRFAAATNLTDEINEAIRLGREVEVPIDLYYTAIAPTEFGQATRHRVKFSPEDMTSETADAFNEAWAAAQEALAQEMQIGDRDEATREVHEQIADQVRQGLLDAAQSPEFARMAAAHWGAFFQTLSTKVSQDVLDEIAARYTPEIRRHIPGLQEYREADGLAVALEVIRRGRVPAMRKRVEKSRGTPMLARIQARGGIVDTGGELAAMNAGQIIRPDTDAGPDMLGDARGDFNEFTADDTLRQLWEEGYFPEYPDRPDVNVLYDAIAEELAGTPRYSAQQDRSADVEVQSARSYVELADLLDEYGLDPDTMTDDEIRAALDQLSNDDPDSGALYQFAGINAATVAPRQYNRALDMDMAGVDRETIFEETGFFKGVDGKWRFEIADTDARLKVEEFTDDGNGVLRRSGPLGEIVDHPKVFEAYPHLATIDASVTINPFAKGRSGVFTGTNIYVIARNEAEARSVLLHEMAHAIQYEEGFASGGNMSLGEVYEGEKVEALQARLAERTEKWESIAEELDAATDNPTRDRLDSELAEINEEIRTLHEEMVQQARFEYYQRIAGEVEARNVQRRDDERLAGEEPDVPWWTADRPESQQYIVTRVQRTGQSFEAMAASDAAPVTIDVDGVALPVNPDGTVTLYHATTPDAAAAIVQSGNLVSAAEQSVYLSTDRAGTGYGDAVVAVDVDPAMLRIDDEFPSGRADFAIDAPAAAVANARIIEQELYQSVAGQGPQADKRGSVQFFPEKTVINLFEQANLSTFLHESGHVFFEIYRDLATREGMPDDLKRDWQIIREYAGIGDDNVISTEAHEKLARTFERYLFEGKAPTDEVAGIMARFRSWLIFVYKHVSALDAPINDKIKGVMDRMIATDEEIASAQSRPEFRPAFKSAEEAGMTQDQWADYLRTAAKAVEQTRRSLTERMLGDVSRETTREWRAARREIRAAVQKELEKLPVYQAVHYLKTGKSDMPNLENVDRMYLDKKSVELLMGEGAVLKLPRGVPPIYRAQGGVHPDILAEVFGFASGYEMLTRMMSVPTLARAVNEETDRRMRDRFGDLMSDAVARAREVDAAIANDVTGDMLATEMEVLMRKGLVTSKIRKQDARRVAREAVRAKPVREAVRAKLYMNADQRAAREAEAAILEGRWVDAVAAKQRQLLNHYMAMEAIEVEKETRTAVNYLQRFTGRKRPKNIDPEYLDQIESLLEKFDMRKSASLKQSQRRASLQAWIEQQEAMGNIVTLPDTVRDDAFRKSYKDMSVEDLLAVRDAVKNIEHLGRLKNELLVNKERREFTAMRDELIGSLAASADQAKTPKTRNPTLLDNAWSFARSLETLLVKIEQAFEWMDGGDPNGPFNRYIWRPIAAAQSRENQMREEYAGKVMRIFEKLDKNRLAERITIAGTSRKVWLRSDILAVALNTGNESNLDKMMRGEGWDKNPMILDTLLAHLNADEASAVQEIWDTINELWPEVAAVQKRLTGVEPPKIEARETEIAGVKLKGGYYPVMYDPKQVDAATAEGRSVIRAQALTDKRLAADDRVIFENVYLRPETRHGFTNERAQKFAMPFLFDIDGLGRHLIEVIHDVTHREAILSANKLLADPFVRGEIESRYGRELYMQMVPWLQNLAHDAYKKDGLGPAESLFRGLRSRATIVAMGFRVGTMLAQLAGIGPSVEVLIPSGSKGGAGTVRAVKALSGAIKDFTAAPRQTWDTVYSKSAEMRERVGTLDRDIRDKIKDLTGRTDFKSRVQKFSMYGIGYMDRAVSAPTWLAAYRLHLQDNPTDEAGAIEAGDRAVRLSQGSGGAKDLAAVQRNSELTKLVTMFYSYFSAYYNRQRNWARDARKAIQNGDAREFPDLLARQVFMTIIPAIMGEMIVGRGPDDEEDETWAWWATKKIASYPFTAIPIMRDIVGALDGPFGYELSPSGRVVNDAVIRPFEIMGDIWDGDADPRKTTRALINAAGYWFALPLGQLATSTNNIWLGIEQDDFRIQDIVLSRPEKR